MKEAVWKKKKKKDSFCTLSYLCTVLNDACFDIRGFRIPRAKTSLLIAAGMMAMKRRRRIARPLARKTIKASSTTMTMKKALKRRTNSKTKIMRTVMMTTTTIMTPTIMTPTIMTSAMTKAMRMVIVMTTARITAASWRRKVNQTMALSPKAKTMIPMRVRAAKGVRERRRCSKYRATKKWKLA